MAKSRTIQLVINGKDRISKKLKKITGSLKKWGVGALKITGGLVAGFGAVGVALGAMFSKLAEGIDEQAKQAAALGISNEALGAMRDAAGYAGISVANLGTALKKMSQGVADAANGTGEAKDAIEALGLDADKLQKMKPEQAFTAIITELDKIPNGIKKTALAMDLFGRSGASMTNLTSKGLKQAQQDAEQLGLKLTTAQAGQVEAANDAWGRVKVIFSDFLKYVTAKIAPSITNTFGKAFEFLKTQDLKGWADKAGSAFLSLGKAILTSIPPVLIVILEIIGKIGMGISGWKMLWNEVKIHAIGFGITMQQILSNMAVNSAAFFSAWNVGGVFDGVIAGLQEFAAGQKGIISEMTKDRDIAITQQVKTVSVYDKQQQGIEDYKKSIASIDAELQKLITGTEKTGTEATSAASVAVSAESSKREAINETTAAINKQREAQRQLNAEQGKSGGSFNVASFKKAVDEESDR